MNTSVLLTERDPMGQAITEYFRTGRAAHLRVFSSQFEEDEFPVPHLFRTLDAMPLLERKALCEASGRILDVGAGSGCHSLVLQEMGKEVEAIDVSPLSVEVMAQRGVRNVRLANLFDERFCGAYDTVLMLMNGSGIVGRLCNLPYFFLRMKQLLCPGGCVLMDSSDLRYVFEDKDGNFIVDPTAGYYGEVDFRMQYRGTEGETFDWLYVDFQTLSFYADENGFRAEQLQKGSHYDYLARLTMKV